MSKNHEKTTGLFGLELLEKLTENDVKRPEDIFVVLYHWKLVSCGYGCIGLGDAKEISGDETPSELLPDAWNTTDGMYLLRYVKNNKLYLSRVVISNTDIILNLIRSEDMKIVSCVVDATKPLDNLEKKAELADKIQKELFDSLEPPEIKSEKKQEDRKLPDLRQETWHQSQSPLQPGYGRADLDPFSAQFGGMGGGNLFPFGGRPSFSGVRFDPINPIRPGPGVPLPGRSNFYGDPDPDHLPPPGHYFM